MPSSHPERINLLWSVQSVEDVWLVEVWVLLAQNTEGGGTRSAGVLEESKVACNRGDLAAFGEEFIVSTTSCRVSLLSESLSAIQACASLVDGSICAGDSL